MPLGVAVRRPTQSWTGVQESLLRERQIDDILALSGSIRLHLRVTARPDDKAKWRASERTIVAAEHRIRALDPSTPDFWSAFRSERAALADAYRAIGVAFEG